MIKINERIYILENHKGGGFSLKDGTIKHFDPHHSPRHCMFKEIPSDPKEIYNMRIKSLMYHAEGSYRFIPEKIMVASQNHLLNMPIDTKNRLCNEDRIYDYVKFVYLTPEEFQMIDDKIL